MATTGEIKDDLEGVLSTLREASNQKEIDREQINEAINDLEYVKSEVQELDDEIMGLL